MSKARVRSTAASAKGVVTIRDKNGRLYQSRPIGTEVPLQKVAWMVRVNRLYSRHEHDYAPLFDGSRVKVCSCGATEGDEEVDG